MKKCVIYNQYDFDELPIKLANAICDTSRKEYGFNFISRESGKELDDVAIVFLIMAVIRKVLNEY